VPATTDPAGAERLSVTANGVRFEALAWGSPDAPLALLLHGFPDCATTWRHLGPALGARGWRTVAPWMRGYGPTGLAPDDSYRIADLVDDVLALHGALDGGDDAVLVGHDWGAATVWAVTQRAPGRFRRVVALALPPPAALLRPFAWPVRFDVGAQQLRASWYFLYNQLPGAERGLDRLVPKLWRDWSPGYDATDDVPSVLAALDGRAERRASLKYYRDNLRGGLRATFATRAGAPALMLHGERDGCIKAGVVRDAEDLLFPGSRMELLPGVGHFLHLEDPARVEALVGEWLEGP